MVRDKTRDNGEEQVAETEGIDTEWFVNRLATIGKSSNGLGRHMGIAGSQVSRMLNGKRKMTIEEVPTIARFLGVTVEEVLKHAGIAPGNKALKSIEATEIMDANSEVHAAKEPIPLPLDLAAKVRGLVPFDKSADAVTALIVAPKGALSVLNDQVVVYEGFANKPPEVGVLSMARLRDGVQVMGRVVAASKTGDVTLEVFGGEKRDVKVSAISKVIGVLQ